MNSMDQRLMKTILQTTAGGSRSVVVSIVLLGILLVAGCGGHDDSHSDEEQMREKSHGEEMHQLLLYGRSTEWVIEYAPLVAGEASSWLIHLTDLETGKPLRSVDMVMRMTFQDGTKLTFRPGPQRDGIFGTSIKSPSAGWANMMLWFDGASISDTVSVDSLPVYKARQDVPHAKGSQEDSWISFTKEESWNIDFATEPVLISRMPSVIKTTGHLQTHPGMAAIVSATASGIISLRSAALVTGQMVTKGEILATVSGAAMTDDNFESRLADAQSAFNKAEADYERSKTLFENEVISRKHLMEAELRYEETKNAMKRFRQDVGSGGKSLRAPLSGYIKEIRVANGGYVREGDPVIVIARNDRILLKAEVYQQDYARLEAITGASFRTASGQVFDVASLNGKMKTRGRAVDASAYSVPVYFELDGSLLVPGEFVDVFLHVSGDQEKLTIPATALTEDLGRYYVYVQRTGEKYEKREVSIDIGNGIRVPVLAGLRAGERIVTTGVYAVRLAASAGQVQADAHAH